MIRQPLHRPVARRPSVAIAKPVAGAVTVRSRRWWVGATGILGSILLHALIVLPLVLEWALPAPHVPNKSGAGASALASDVEPTMTLILINNPSSSEQRFDPEPPELVSRGSAALDMPIIVLSPDALAAVKADPTETQPDPSAPAQALGDQAQHALLFGRYLGQVQARIERAWMRPRSAIGAAQFACRARIEQDRQGGVVDVKLDHCQGSERWQYSLVSAIRTASPLPAPPDASVYADVLLLSFGSQAYVEGTSNEGYEVETRATLAAVQQSDNDRSLRQLAEAVHAREGDAGQSNVIHLTIIGTPDRAPPVPPDAVSAQPLSQAQSSAEQ